MSMLHFLYQSRYISRYTTLIKKKNGIISPSFSKYHYISTSLYSFTSINKCFIQKRNFSEFLTRMNTYKDKIALVDTYGEWTYKQLLSSARLLANQLKPQMEKFMTLHGSTEAPRIAYLCPRDHTYVVANLAAWYLNATCVPLAESHPASELEYFIHDAAPFVLIAARSHEKVAEQVKTLTGIHIEYVEVLNIKSSLNNNANNNDKSDIMNVQENLNLLPLETNENLEEGAMIVYTSGTTAKPKGVVSSRRGLRAQIHALSQAWEWSASDRILHVLPLHHVHGIMAVLLCALWNGATVEMMSKFSAPQVYAALARPPATSNALTLFMAVPTIYAKLLTHHNSLPLEEQERWIKSMKTACSLRLMVSGSAALPEPVMRAWKDITNVTLLERFGMTELGMAISNPYREVGDIVRTPSSVGLPLPGYEVALLDEKGQIIPTMSTESGELLVRGDGLFAGYWKKPDATKETKTSDGVWFRTGDSAHRDARGFYYIDGRLSADIIKSSGYKLSALEIERHLLDHPGVDEIAVFGIPNEVTGETVVALVVPQGDTATSISSNAKLLGNKEGLRMWKGSSATSNSNEIRSWAKKSMAAYKIPTRLHFVPEIPRNAMGKVNKKALKIQYLAIQDTV